MTIACVFGGEEFENEIRFQPSRVDFAEVPEVAIFIGFLMYSYIILCIFLPNKYYWNFTSKLSRCILLNFEEAIY